MSLSSEKLDFKYNKDFECEMFAGDIILTYCAKCWEMYFPQWMILAQHYPTLSDRKVKSSPWALVTHSYLPDPSDLFIQIFGVIFSWYNFIKTNECRELTLYSSQPFFNLPYDLLCLKSNVNTVTQNSLDLRWMPCSLCYVPWVTPTLQLINVNCAKANKHYSKS